MNLSRTVGMGEVDMKPCCQLGVETDYYFNTHRGMKTSLILIGKGHKCKATYDYSSGYSPPGWDGTKYKSSDMTQTRTYVEIPVMLSYRFGISGNMKIAFRGGIYGSYGIGGRSKNKHILEDGAVSKDDVYTFSHEINRFDAGIGTGVDLEYKNKYIIGLIGEWGLKPFVKEMKNQTYGLNIGYKF
jgi:hypothetical protein